MSEQKHAAEVLADECDRSAEGWLSEVETRRRAAAMLRTIPKLEAESDLWASRAASRTDNWHAAIAERDAAISHQSGALGLVASIRWALGDNGRRMQDELIAWCRTLRTAEQERDALRADFRRLNEKHTNLHMNADACRKERDALRADLETEVRLNNEGQAREDALRAEVEALRADAERYRWLRAKENQDNEAWNSFGPYNSPHEIDAAIDAARAAAAGGKA